MGLTVVSIFSAPSIQATEVSSNIVAKQQAVEIRQLDTNWKNVPTQFINAGGINFAYREYGQENGGTPVIFLNHLAAVLDNWDPRILMELQRNIMLLFLIIVVLALLLAYLQSQLNKWQTMQLLLSRRKDLNKSIYLVFLWEA
jgi:hypothetical protein